MSLSSTKLEPEVSDVLQAMHEYKDYLGSVNLRHVKKITTENLLWAQELCKRWVVINFLLNKITLILYFGV